MIVLVSKYLHYKQYVQSYHYPSNSKRKNCHQFPCNNFLNSFNQRYFTSQMYFCIELSKYFKAENALSDKCYNN